MKRNCVYNYINNNQIETRDKNIVINVIYDKNSSYTSNYILVNSNHSCYELHKLEKDTIGEKITDKLLLKIVWEYTKIITKYIINNGRYTAENSDEFIDLICEV